MNDPRGPTLSENREPMNGDAWTAMAKKAFAVLRRDEAESAVRSWAYRAGRSAPEDLSALSKDQLAEAASTYRTAFFAQGGRPRVSQS